jgi:hypothetical protein
MAGTYNAGDDHHGPGAQPLARRSTRRRERLAFGELRRWVADTGADARLMIVDSCRSGALVAGKGGTPAPPFAIRLSDELRVTRRWSLAAEAQLPVLWVRKDGGDHAALLPAGWVGAEVAL